jgi:uncharacterized glyoxalase superfamily protein PhnB
MSEHLDSAATFAPHRARLVRIAYRMMVSAVVETPAEAERIYGELSADGQITMPMAETFWAHRFGMFTDRYGIPWMVNCEKSM